MTEKLRNLLFKIFKPDTFLGKAVDKIITREIISYLIFGVLTTVVSWVSYALFIRIIPDSVNSGSFSFPEVFGDTFKIFICNIISWVLSVLFAFITNKLFVFESKSFAPAVAFKELASFIGSRLFTGFLEWFGVPLLVKIGFNQSVFNTEGMLAKILVSVIIVILNYIFSKILVFRKKTN